MINLTVTIVIATYKRPGLALSLSKLIRRYHPQIEIIIVDQKKSSKISKKSLERYRIKFFNLDVANSSLAKNKGINEASGEIIIFFDDDVEITSHTVPNHLAAYNDRYVVGTTGRVINDGEIVPKNTQVETGKTNFLGTKFLMQFWSTKKQFIDFPYGCNMSFRKEIIKKVGYFDLNFSKIFDEIDLGVRISSKYGLIKFLPEALVYHHKATFGGSRFFNKEKQKIVFYSYGYYLAKNIPFPFSMISLFLRTITALKKAPFVLKDLYRGYLSHFLTKFTPFNIFVLLVFSIILFLRLWKVPEFFNFTLGEEIQALMAWEQVKNFHPIWIGVSAANVKYQYGPGFTYLNALLFYLSKDPVILAYFSAMLGIVTLISLYYVVKNLFSKKTAFFATVIYGCSTLINFHDRRFWTPTPVPLITILFIYSLIKAKENTRWFILTSVLIGLSFHLHLSLLLLLLPMMFSVISNFKKIKLTTWLVMIFCYLFLTSPLIVFDLVHNYDNLLMPIRVLIGKQQTELSSFTITNTIKHLKLTLSTLGRIWFIKLYTNPHDEVVLESHKNITQGNIILSSLSLISFFWFLLKNRKPGYRLLFISLIIIPLSYILYPSYNPEYYLMSFITLMTIVIGFWLQSLQNIISTIIITFFVLTNFLTIITTSDRYGLIVKKQLVEQAMSAIDNQSFYLDVAGSIPTRYYPYAGWRYLFKAYGKTPTQSSTDDFMGWIYKDELSKEKPKFKVIVSDTIQPKFEKKPLYMFKSGPYYAYIFNNEKN